MKNNLMICKYCNNVMEQDPYNYFCKNHGSVFLKNNDSRMALYNSKYYISIFYDSNRMFLCKVRSIMGYHVYTDAYSFNIPLDKSLTPENFEQKVRTYLVFQ